MEQTPALGTRIIPKSHASAQLSKPPLHVALFPHPLNLTSFIPNKSMYFRFPQQQVAINSVKPSLGSPNTHNKCHCNLPVTPLWKRGCMAHWQRHTGLFLEDACSRAGLVPASCSAGLYLILKQCSFTRFLCLTKVQKVFSGGNFT